MLQPQRRDPRSEQVEGRQADPLESKLWHSALVRLFDVRERVVKRLADAVFDDWLAIQRNRVAQIERQQPQVVEAENVVGVLVGIEDGVNQPDFFAEKLLPQIGRRIDQQIALRQ